jgi:hypothetical protein
MARFEPTTRKRKLIECVVDSGGGPKGPAEGCCESGPVGCEDQILLKACAAETDYQRYRWYMKHGPVFYLHQWHSSRPSEWLSSEPISRQCTSNPLPIRVQRQTMVEDAKGITFQCTLNNTYAELGKQLNQPVLHTSAPPYHFCICTVDKNDISRCYFEYMFKLDGALSTPLDRWYFDVRVPPSYVCKDYVLQQRYGERTILALCLPLVKELVNLVHDYLSVAWDDSLDEVPLMDS